MASSDTLSTIAKSFSWGHPCEFPGGFPGTRFLPKPKVHSHQDICFVTLPSTTSNPIPAPAGTDF